MMIIYEVRYDWRSNDFQNSHWVGEVYNYRRKSSKFLREELLFVGASLSQGKSCLVICNPSQRVVLQYTVQWVEFTVVIFAIWRDKYK